MSRKTTYALTVEEDGETRELQFKTKKTLLKSAQAYQDRRVCGEKVKVLGWLEVAISR